MYYTNQMTAFVMFSTNYNPNFITEAFGNNLHLQAKWNSIASVMNTPTESYGRMVKFWTELSDNNRETLANYIKAKYVKPEPTKEEKEQAEVMELARVRSLTNQYKDCAVHVCMRGATGTYYVCDWYDPSCIATFVNGVKQ